MAVVRFFTLNVQSVKNLKPQNRHELKGVSVAAAMKWASDSLAISPELSKEVIEVVVTNDKE